MHQAMKGLAHATAITGGLVLVGLVILATVSITGRTIGPAAQSVLNLDIGEIAGSYEVLEAGVAFAIFSFFPICQFYTSHATVDVFTVRLGAGGTRWLMAFWEVVLTATLILISVQLFGGVQRYYNNGETTLFLQFPLWWAYTASFAASVVTCVVALYCAAARIFEAATDRSLLPHV